MKRSYVISIEGGEGTGKSTVIKYLKEYFCEKEIECLITREPGGVMISEKIRDIILDVNHTQMDAKTEALLYAAARRQHLIEKVIPAVSEEKLVIFDRYVDSSLVYQGYVRGIGIDKVYEINKFATEGFLPDLTLCLDLDPKIGFQRINANKDREINRLDLENMEFHNKVREGYCIIADKFNDRIEMINANQSIDDVLLDIKKVIEEKLKL